MIGEIEKSLPTLRQALLLFVDSNSSRPLDCHGNRDLSCSCAIASRTVVFFLKNLGLHANIAYGTFDDANSFRDSPPDPLMNTNHAWTEFGDHIIDLTASQFNNKLNTFPDILITGKDDKRYFKFGETNFKKLEPFYEWPHQQLPRKKYINKILKNYDDLSTTI